MGNPFSRVLMFLSFIKGDKVQEWTQEQLRWAMDYIAQAPGNDNHEYLWTTVSNAFFRAFTNITREVDAQTDIKTLKMKGDHGLDDYISSFERLARLGGYNLADQAVVDMFIDRLPASLAVNVAKFNNPNNFNDWKQGAVEHHMNICGSNPSSTTKDGVMHAPHRINGRKCSQRRGMMLWIPRQDASKPAPLTHVHPLMTKNVRSFERKDDVSDAENKDTLVEIVPTNPPERGETPKRRNQKKKLFRQCLPRHWP